MRDRGFIPTQAKSVVHEARNGVLMCKNHHGLFNAYFFYIRWVPEVRYCSLSFTVATHTTPLSQFGHFVFVNHSQHPASEQYHGHAINLNAGDPCLPFHGAFLIQEMRVRGRWPFRTDRPISVPIDWQGCLPAADDDDDHHNNNKRPGNPDPEGNDAANRETPPSAVMRMPPLPTLDSGLNTHLIEDTLFSVNAATRRQPQTFTPTNLFANPAELRAMKHSFSQQPNWKAAVVEGETWEGSAEENIAKWGRLVGRP